MLLTVQRLERSEVLRNLRHYTCGHKAVDVTLSITWKTRVSQTNIATVSKATPRKLPRDRVKHI